MITKQVNQIWFQSIENLPDKYKENIKSIVDQNPGWVFKYWDDASMRKLIGSLGEKYLQKYDSFKLMLQKIDFSRYAILYSEGGVSIDTDVFALQPLDKVPHLNDRDFIVSSNSIDSFINNATILIKKNHPLMKELLDSIVDNNNTYFNDTLTILKTTGPLAFTKFVNKHKDEITILDHTYLEPCSGMNKYCSIPDNAILNHKHDGTWIPSIYKNMAKAHYYALEHKEVLIMIGLVILILIVVASLGRS